MYNRHDTRHPRLAPSPSASSSRADLSLPSPSLSANNLVLCDKPTYDKIIKEASLISLLASRLTTAASALWAFVRILYLY